MSLSRLVAPSNRAIYEEQKAFQERERAPLFVIKGALATVSISLLEQMLNRHPAALKTKEGHFGLRDPELARSLVSAALGKLGRVADVEPIVWILSQRADFTSRIPVAPVLLDELVGGGEPGLGRWLLSFKIGSEIANYYLSRAVPSPPVECSRLPLDFGSAVIYREPFSLCSSLCSEDCFIATITFHTIK